MIDIQAASKGLELGEDGIWYSAETENISYPKDSNQACYAVEENSFWFRHRNNCILSSVKTYPPEDNGTIFDIGGGNGFVASGLSSAGFEVALVEPGITGASQAKKRGLKNVICATTNTAKFKPQSLPAVGLFDVIEHIEDDLAFLKSIKGLIKKGGYLYVTVPSYPFLWSDEDIIAGHFRRYTLESISDVLKLAGFQIEFSSYIFRLLPLPTFILRTLPYRLGLSKEEKKGDYFHRDHMVKGGMIGKVLDSLLQPEIVNLNKKKSMLFGGSCLVVVKKGATNLRRDK